MDNCFQYSSNIFDMLKLLFDSICKDWEGRSREFLNFKSLLETVQLSRWLYPSKERWPQENTYLLSVSQSLHSLTVSLALYLVFKTYEQILIWCSYTSVIYLPDYLQTLLHIFRQTNRNQSFIDVSREHSIHMK